MARAARPRPHAREPRSAPLAHPPAAPARHRHRSRPPAPCAAYPDLRFRSAIAALCRLPLGLRGRWRPPSPAGALALRNPSAPSPAGALAPLIQTFDFDLRLPHFVGFLLDFAG